MDLLYGAEVACLAVGRRVEQLLLPLEACSHIPHVLDQHLRIGRHSCLSCPVALQFRRKDSPGERNATRLNHSLDCHLVRFHAYTAPSVGDEVHLISLTQCLNDWKRETDLGPKRRHDDFLPARIFYPRDDTLVLPGVDERTVDRLLLGK